MLDPEVERDELINRLIAADTDLTDEAATALEAAERENKALRAALERQRTNIEHWLETGEAASREESKSIYDQICAALVKP